MVKKFNAVRELVSRGYAQAAGVGAGLFLPLMARADATLPAGATQLFTDTAVLFGLLIAAAYVLMLAITGGWITFDMVKKGAKKSAK